MRTKRLRCRVPRGVGRRGSGHSGAPSVGVVKCLRDGRRSGGYRRCGSATSGQPRVSCSVPTIYNVNQMGDLYALNYTATPPADSPATPSSIGGGSRDVNALAISADGLTVYSADQTPSSATTTVHVEDIATGTNSDFTVPATNVVSVNSGGVNPTNGDYYYGGWNSMGSTFSLFAFDPTTDIGHLAGTITPPPIRPTNPAT